MRVEKILEQAIKEIRAHLGNRYKIYLFGSQAKANAGITSDLDIGLLGDEPINPITMVKIKEDIDHIPTLRTIDILDLLATSQDFRETVLKEGRLIHE